MSQSDSDFDLPTENTKLMDGHVSTDSGDLRQTTNENTRKRKPRVPPEQGLYQEVSIFF